MMGGMVPLKPLMEDRAGTETRNIACKGFPGPSLDMLHTAKISERALTVGTVYCIGDSVCTYTLVYIYICG